MLLLSRQVNSLKQFVEDHNLYRRTAYWMPVDDVQDFPRLDEEQLRDITCGCYQLKLSPSYAQEHLKGDCSIHVHREEIGLLRVRLQSRHVSAKSYMLWIRYDEACVLAWYCKCRVGARVVGVCAHVAAVMWYLGYGRFLEMSAHASIGVRNWGEFVQSAADLPPEAVDESDDSDEDSDEDSDD